ncbi:MAG TPA: glycosyltransferase family A protein [Actinomycetota bacterium]|nr:glycosyltransferase family A protein [Actinomycetota bacterium]
MTPRNSSPTSAGGPSVLACLVHEAPDCVADLIANLRCLDPEATILLYDGGASGAARGFHRPGDGVHVHPASHPIGWGRLHEFAVDCLRYGVDDLGMAAMTMLDSDQLLVRPGYSAALLRWLAGHPSAGCLVTAPGVQPPGTMIGPAQAAWREIDRWRPFLSRFPGGQDKFPHWTFWPGTVFTGSAASAALGIWGDDQLRAILAGTEMWATEEIVLPSLVALAGHEVVANPFSLEFVRYRSELTLDQLDLAYRRPDAFWAHPIARRYDDPIRRAIREHFGYTSSPPAGNGGPSSAAAPPAVPGTPRRVQVSCVLPVTASLHQVAQGVRYFLRQDFADCELVIVDDGAVPAATVAPADPRIRCIRLDGPASLGQKRNIGCAQAWGEIIVNWDDTSWHAGWRVAHQVEALRRAGAEVCGLRRFPVVRPPSGPAWWCEPPGQAAWVADATACFRRRLWERYPFGDADHALDAAYLSHVAPERILALPDTSFFVAISRGDLNGDGMDCLPRAVGELRAVLGADWAFYEDASGEAAKAKSRAADRPR